MGRKSAPLFFIRGLVSQYHSEFLRSEFQASRGIFLLVTYQTPCIECKRELFEQLRNTNQACPPQQQWSGSESVSHSFGQVNGLT